MVVLNLTLGGHIFLIVDRGDGFPNRGVIAIRFLILVSISFRVVLLEVIGLILICSVIGVNSATEEDGGS